MIGLDSNILIGLLRKTILPQAISKHEKEGLCASEITVYEVAYGIYAAKIFNEIRLRQFEAVLDTLTHVFPLDRNASMKAAEIGGELTKQGRTIEHRDALIAGSLLANGCAKLITTNAKDFANIKGLSLVTV
jgi:predicted nucleic acid-binding protein